ncbi:tripartite tricarboxylate transporter TctB family protein [Mycobacterium sp. CPCC 205372]|uniref:Tripartite tricarboxylate transporter TctB family protein n=1 Tax=Mycobacterium hippophais TaxID=3016340 RepID=A0ABT4PT85_9MYCO|nr:tripartite tricarboxylate transporter TctB family protein [Mycobacterium hippophais]MCZ8379802.1 tripartite tricarboxylate transporter TctB family protein [Mycobacterium hippophais]
MTATTPFNMATAAVSESTEPKRVVNWPRLTFLGVLLIAFAFYTEIAMGMEWRTQAGRIGPGVFPRILGFTAIAVIVIAAVRDVLSRPSAKPVSQAEAADEAAEPDLGRHPVALVAFTIAAAVFVALLGVLGAALAGVLFLAVTLWFLDPKHHVRSLIIAVTVPVLLYLAFQTGLNVGLPQGILPIG